MMRKIDEDPVLQKAIMDKLFSSGSNDSKLVGEMV